MKLSKSLFTIIVVIFILGAAIFLYMRSESAKRIAKLQEEVANLEERLEVSEQGPTFEFRAMASRPIENLYAQNLIRNYNCVNPRLQNTDGVILKGWHIEKKLIDSLFAAYADREVTGLQVYLGKHEEADNRSHTLIWMAVKDTTAVIEGRTLETTKLLIDRPRTIFQYVKPCPINCPINDFQFICSR